MDDGMFVVASGNPFDGLRLFGPFWSHQQACEWTEHMDEDWWIVKVENV
jgi:hypothetical protein